MRHAFAFIFCFIFAQAAHSANLGAISNANAAGGLKQALTDGSAAAVNLLGKENGFFGNPKVRIPLLPALAQIEGALRLMGRKQPPMTSCLP